MVATSTVLSILSGYAFGLMRFRGSSVAGSAEWDEAVRIALLALAPAAPHITEELWSRRLAVAGVAWSSIHTEAWPEVDLVQIDTEWVKRFAAILDLLRRILLIASIVLALVQLLRLAIGYWAVRRLKRKGLPAGIAMPVPLYP